MLSDGVAYLFDMLEMREKHSGCCYGSMSTVWSENTTEKAFNLLKGRTLKVCFHQLANSKILAPLQFIF